MSEAAWKRQFDADFDAAWAEAMGGIDAVYTPPGGAAITVQVLVDTGVEQFGEDGAPVSYHDRVVGFRREQIEPKTLGTVVVDGTTLKLVQRVERSDESRSWWAVEEVTDA